MTFFFFVLAWVGGSLQARCECVIKQFFVCVSVVWVCELGYTLGVVVNVSLHEAEYVCGLKKEGENNILNNPLSQRVAS